jgi:hypothetical protein
MFHPRLLSPSLPAHDDATQSQSVGLLRAAFPVTYSHHQSSSPQVPNHDDGILSHASFHAPSRSVVECTQQLSAFNVFNSEPKAHTWHSACPPARLSAYPFDRVPRLEVSWLGSDLTFGSFDQPAPSPNDLLWVPRADNHGASFYFILRCGIATFTDLSQAKTLTTTPAGS